MQIKEYLLLYAIGGLLSLLAFIRSGIEYGETIDSWDGTEWMIVFALSSLWPLTVFYVYAVPWLLKNGDEEAPSQHGDEEAPNQHGDEEAPNQHGDEEAP